MNSQMEKRLLETFTITSIVLSVVFCLGITTNSGSSSNNPRNNTPDINSSLNRLLEYYYNASCDTIDINGREISHIRDICDVCKLGQDAGNKNGSSDFVSEFGEWRCNCSLIFTLDMSNNYITELPISIFSCLENIVNINISGNSLSKISDNVFGDLKKMEVLALSGNSLVGIRHGDFRGLVNLEELLLSDNNIHNIEIGSFGGLTGLRLLDLSDNQLRTLHRRSLEGLDNLNVLYVQGNKLSEPSVEFLAPLIHLNIIDLSRNIFKEIKMKACGANSLTSISLRQTSTLDYLLADSFGNCTHVEQLDLSENANLFYVDEGSISVDVLPNLKLLNLTGTHILMLPEIANTTRVVAERKNIDNEACLPMMLLSYSINSIQPDNETNSSTESCGPFIIPTDPTNMTAYIGDVLHIRCFAVGNPWPKVAWTRVSPTGTKSKSQVLASNYSLILRIKSLSLAGKYRCVSESGNTTAYKEFNIKVKHTDFGIKTLASSARAIVITWNKTHYLSHHVVLYRAFEKTAKYTRQHINEYWKIFKINSLVPDTHYEVCIASYSDVNDRSCVRTLTLHELEASPGIHHNVLAIVALSISGLVFSLFLISTFYRCVRKMQVIVKRNVFIVGTESRDHYDDITETTFLYENQYTDLLLDNQEKTEC